MYNFACNIIHSTLAGLNDYEILLWIFTVLCEI